MNIEGIGNCAWTDKAIILFWQDRYFFRVSPDPTQQADAFPALNDLTHFSRRMNHALAQTRQP